jgi:hypothetical protein|tara:strand:+ start:487 stop:1836 length:1350 start_codon:yes stop_codon:yes gene_type:complete
VSYYRFGKDDLFYSRLKTFPKNEFWITGSNIFLNNEQRFKGSLYPNGATDAGGIVLHLGNSADLSSGSISLYEMNVDRPFVSTVTASVIKTGELESFKSVTSSSFSESDYGTIFSTQYPLSASISIDFVSASNGFAIADINAISPTGSTVSGYQTRGYKQLAASSTTRHVEALRNTFNNYATLSQHYQFSSSKGGDTGWEKDKQAMSFINIPSIFYGSSINKGSVRLRFYITGTLLGELKDEKQNGELVQVGPYGSGGSGSTAGVVLYNEGIITLTGSWDPSNGSITASFLGGGANGVITSDDMIAPAWKYFGLLGATGSSVSTASYHMEFEGINYVPTMTMHALAPRGELNHSNNPTFAKYNFTSGSFNSGSGVTTGSAVFNQNPNLESVAVNSSSFSSYSSSYESTTYISKIGIYDDFDNLIGVAKLATPIRKREKDDLTFRLKLDI